MRKSAAMGVEMPVLVQDDGVHFSFVIRQLYALAGTDRAAARDHIEFGRIRHNWSRY